MATNHTSVPWVGIGPGMFIKLPLCVWKDPEPFPYLEILREENQSEPKPLIDWLMFFDKQRRLVRGRRTSQNRTRHFLIPQ